MPTGTMTTVKLLSSDSQYTFRATGAASAFSAQLSYVGGNSCPFAFQFHDALVVGGTLQVGTDNSDAIECEGDIVAFTSSDKNLKTNFKLLDSPLKKLKTISGYRFQWKDDDRINSKKRGKLDVGVIAQEVQSILPEAVRESHGVLSVEYIKLIPLLIESIKELEQRVAELEHGG